MTKHNLNTNRKRKKLKDTVYRTSNQQCITCLCKRLCTREQKQIKGSWFNEANFHPPPPPINHFHKKTSPLSRTVDWIRYNPVLSSICWSAPGELTYMHCKHVQWVSCWTAPSIPTYQGIFHAVKNSWVPVSQWPSHLTLSGETRLLNYHRSIAPWLSSSHYWHWWLILVWLPYILSCSDR